jgi:hypothetical protein
MFFGSIFWTELDTKTKIMDFLNPISTYFQKKNFWPYLVIFRFKKLISAKEDMKIKKNTFSTLVLELFFPSISNCRKLKIQNKPKSDFP